jgi:hypothetical protein
MSDDNYKPEIYDQQLNARDAWSYLVIKYANHNLRFTKSCNSTSQTTIEYDLDGGLSKDSKIPNFLQLIKNLLKIDKWDGY